MPFLCTGSRVSDSQPAEMKHRNMKHCSSCNHALGNNARIFFFQDRPYCFDCCPWIHSFAQTPPNFYVTTGHLERLRRPMTKIYDFRSTEESDSTNAFQWRARDSRPACRTPPIRFRDSELSLSSDTSVVSLDSIEHAPDYEDEDDGCDWFFSMESFEIQSEPDSGCEIDVTCEKKLTKGSPVSILAIDDFEPSRRLRRSSPDRTARVACSEARRRGHTPVSF